jgi:hypothetical protein
MKMAKRSEAEIMKEIHGLYSRLSPEALYCDGEIAVAAARRRGEQYHNRLQECFRELGREVSKWESGEYAFRSHK